MPNFAVINGDKVANVIVADSKEDAELNSGLPCIEIFIEPGAPGIGWTYDGNSFAAPVVEEVSNG
jgi:hypothetical protein